MSDHKDTQGEIVTRMVAAVVAWIGSVSLADVQLVVAIMSGVAVFCYTVVNTYVLWRDKIRGKR